MSCNNNQQKITSLCENISSVIDCVETIHQEESKEVSIKLVDTSGLPLDLDIIRTIAIVLYDARKYRIARFYYDVDATSSDTTYDIDTYFDEYAGFDETSEIWFDDQPITILQDKLSTESYASMYGEDIYVDKGKIAFLLTDEITKSLMIGNLYIDIRILTDAGKLYIINCFNIGIVRKNKFV